MQPRPSAGAREQAGFYPAPSFPLLTARLADPRLIFVPPVHFSTIPIPRQLPFCAPAPTTGVGSRSRDRGGRGRRVSRYGGARTGAIDRYQRKRPLGLGPRRRAGDATLSGAASWALHKLTSEPDAIARIYTIRSQWPSVQATVETLPSPMRSQQPVDAGLVHRGGPAEMDRARLPPHVTGGAWPGWAGRQTVAATAA